MKAKHRHELKTNELAQWLANFPQWAKNNLTTIIYVSVVIAVVAGLYIWRIYSRNIVSVRKQLRFTALLNRLAQSKSEILRARAQGFDISHILFEPANSLRTFAQNEKDDVFAAMAFIKHAEALRTELHYRQGIVPKRDFAAQLNQAKTSYNEAISRLTRPTPQGTINPSLTAMATLGLGLCEEELGNFDQARQIYHTLVANPYFDCTVATAQAKLRLDTMVDYRKTVAFKSPPRPTKSTLPEIQLKPADVNLVPQMPKIEIKPVAINLPETKPKATDTNLSDANRLSQ
jgi:hypothetical protein